MSNNNGNIKALEVRVKELEEENNSLSGRLEEIMLLSLITESFEAISDEDVLLISVLEKISILKNIPYCACYEIENDHYKCVGQYCSYYTKTPCKGVVTFSEELLKEFDTEAVIRYQLKERPNSITFNTTEKLFEPNEVLALTFHSRRIKKGIFVFVSNGNVISPFAQELMPYHQIIQMVIEKWDRLSLLKELQELNYKLEERVEERTLQLKESEAKYRQLFDMANDAIYLWELGENDKVIGCLQSNDAVRQLTGYSQSELYHINPFDLLASSYSSGERKDIEQQFLKKSASFKASFKTKKGIIPLEVNTRRFQMNSRQVIIAIARDVSDRQAFEEKLIEAKNKAVESEQLKSAFLANMSHEIRTPMNAIVGFSELLSQDVMEEGEVKMYANIIFKNSMHLLNLIDDIVDYSKIEANQVFIVNNTVNINELLSDLSVNMISILHKSSKNHIDILTHTPLTDKEATIIVDGTRLRQILANLVNNAIKFTHDGFIELGYDLKSEGMLEFFVRDTGIGIAVKDQKKVFERFVQLKDEKVIHPGGTGLGLAICSNLLEKMHGKIYLKSEPDKGTTFYFTVPHKLST